MNEIAQQVNLSLAAAGRTVDKLVGTGLVDRREDIADRRVKRVSLTAEGTRVVDSQLRIPNEARVLGDDAVTNVVTTSGSRRGRRDDLRGRGIWVTVVPAGPNGVDLGAAMHALLRAGIRSVLVDGGARVITSFLSAGLADRLVVGISPRVIGSGTEAILDLGITEVTSSIRLDRRSVHAVGEDVLIAGDIIR